jgi:hypothetical protein
MPHEYFLGLQAKGASPLLKSVELYFLLVLILVRVFIGRIRDFINFWNGSVYGPHKSLFLA